MGGGEGDWQTEASRSPAWATGGGGGQSISREPSDRGPAEPAGPTCRATCRAGGGESVGLKTRLTSPSWSVEVDEPEKAAGERVGAVPHGGQRLMGHLNGQPIEK